MPVLTNFAGTTVIGFQRPNGTIFTLAEIQNEGYTPDNALASVPSDDRRTTHHLVQRYRRQSLPITRPATGNPTLPFDDVRLEWREVPSSTPIHLHDLDRNERVSPADGWTTAGGGHTIPLSHLRPVTSYRVDFHVLNEFNQGLVGSRTFRMEAVNHPLRALTTAEVNALRNHPRYVNEWDLPAGYVAARFSRLSYSGTGSANPVQSVNILGRNNIALYRWLFIEEPEANGRVIGVPVFVFTPITAD